MIRLVWWKDNVGENLFHIHELYCNWGIGSFQKLVKRAKETERRSIKETEHQFSRKVSPSQIEGSYPKFRAPGMTDQRWRPAWGTPSTAQEMIMQCSLPGSVQFWLYVCLVKYTFLMLAKGYKLCYKSVLGISCTFLSLSPSVLTLGRCVLQFNPTLALIDCIWCGHWTKESPIKF